ncbi:hypothetical protein CBL_00619 [Carabus blaptoides fortunei]
MLATRYSSIFVVWLFVTTVSAQAPATASDGLLLPVSIGVLLKVILVVFGVLVKLLFLGLTSLGGSGVALLLTLLFLKNNAWTNPPLWSGHPHGWTDRNWPLLKMQHIHPGYHRRRYGKEMNQVPFLYKPESNEYNGHHPVPVDTMDPRSMPHQRLPSETEYVSQEKEIPKLAQTHVSAN